MHGHQYTDMISQTTLLNEHLLKTLQCCLCPRSDGFVRFAIELEALLSHEYQKRRDDLSVASTNWNVGNLGVTTNV
jgi:hypothetical protein